MRHLCSVGIVGLAVVTLWSDTTVATTSAMMPIAAAMPAAPPSPSAAAFEDQVLTLVNQRRAAGALCGDTAFAPAEPLTMSPALRTAARGHSEDMAAHSYFSHVGLDGRTVDYRIRDAGYAGPSLWGENIAAGQATPASVIDSWMGSPGHCRNIMSSRFTALGVGYAFRAGSPYGHYWTQAFGGR